jgi:hypothetical protein
VGRAGGGLGSGGRCLDCSGHWTVSRPSAGRVGLAELAETGLVKRRDKWSHKRAKKKLA